jgi:hypothetical protein
MKNRTKKILAIITFLIIVIISYKFAFSKTIEVNRELKIINKEIDTLENVSKLSFNLKRREQFLDSILSKNNLKNTSIQNNLLDVLNKESFKLGFMVSKFNKPHVFEENSIIATSYSFILEGDFNNLLQMIYILEMDYNFGEIIHISFIKKRNYQKKVNYLQCYVILKNLVGE